MSKRFLGYGHQCVNDQDIATVEAVLRSDYLTQGPVVERFEAVLAERVGVRFAVAVSSGTAALHLACLAAGLKAGDAGLTSTMTFAASANAFAYCGARPLLCDVDLRSINISVEQAACALDANEAIKVIIPVHFAGLSADVKALREHVGEKVTIIEDACHALGGNDEDENPVGQCAYSDMTVFSFHPVKPITTGEGGMVTTNNRDLYVLLLKLRSHGIERDPSAWKNISTDINHGEAVPSWYYEQQLLGFNYRMTEFQAALGLSQLDKLSSFVRRRREIVDFYDTAFRSVTHLVPIQIEPGMRARSGHHLYVLRCDFDAIGKTREQVMADLRVRNIGTQVHYIPVHRQPYHQNSQGWKSADFPNAELFYEQALSIPLFPDITDEEAVYISQSIGEVCCG